MMIKLLAAVALMAELSRCDSVRTALELKPVSLIQFFDENLNFRFETRAQEMLDNYDKVLETFVQQFPETFKFPMAARYQIVTETQFQSRHDKNLV